MMNRKIEPQIERKPDKQECIDALRKEIKGFKGRKNSDIYLLKKLSEKEQFSQTDIRKIKGYEIRDKNGNKTKDYLKTMKQIKSFEEKGYIKNIGKDKGQIFYKIEDFVLDEMKKVNCDINHAFKITAFDEHILNLVSNDGKIDLSKIDDIKKISILKRLETYDKAGYIHKKVDGNYLDEAVICDIRAKIEEKNIKLKRKKERNLELNLSDSEAIVLKDINKFGMLSEKQIEKYIGKIDYEQLLKEKILCYDKKYKVYTLGKKGEIYVKALDKEALKYKTKAKGRREEIEHDKLVYTAYKEEMKRLKNIGAKIVSEHTDRELRSIEAKKYGHIVSSLPDFRIEYYVKGVSGICRLDIEIDVGYKDKVIASKIKGMVDSAISDNIKPGNYSIVWVKKGGKNVSYKKIANSAMKGVNELKKNKKGRIVEKTKGKNKGKYVFRLVRALNKTGRNFKQKRALKPKHIDNYLNRLEVKKADEEI